VLGANSRSNGLHTPRVEPSERHLPGALAELQGVGRWDGLHIYPDAELGPDGHWQFPRISAARPPKTAVRSRSSVLPKNSRN